MLFTEEEVKSYQQPEESSMLHSSQLSQDYKNQCIYVRSNVKTQWWVKFTHALLREEEQYKEKSQYRERR
jgi:hypothetical protein